MGNEIIQVNLRRDQIYIRSETFIRHPQLANFLALNNYEFILKFVHTMFNLNTKYIITHITS